MALSRVGMRREFVSILQLMTVTDWLGVGGSLATILSVLVAGYALWRQLGVLRVQLAVEHFGDHSRRFLEVMERLPEEVHDPAFCLEGRDDAGASRRRRRALLSASYVRESGAARARAPSASRMARQSRQDSSSICATGITVSMRPATCPLIA